MLFMKLLCTKIHLSTSHLFILDFVFVKIGITLDLESTNPNLYLVLSIFDSFPINLVYFSFSHLYGRCYWLTKHIDILIDHHQFLGIFAVSVRTK